MYQIIIEAADAQDLAIKILELTARVIPQAAADDPPAPSEPLATIVPSGPAFVVSAIGDGDGSGSAAPGAPAGGVQETPNAAGAQMIADAAGLRQCPQPSEEPKLSAEDLRSQLRATLAPLLAGPNAAQAKKLVADNGGAVSKIPEDRLAAVLEAAKALAS